MPLAGLAAPKLSLQASFDGVNGQALGATLIAAANGLYYGPTAFGGAFGWSRPLRRRGAQANPRRA